MKTLILISLFIAQAQAADWLALGHLAKKTFIGQSKPVQNLNLSDVYIQNIKRHFLQSGPELFHLTSKSGKLIVVKKDAIQNGLGFSNALEVVVVTKVVPTLLRDTNPKAFKSALDKAVLDRRSQEVFRSRLEELGLSDGFMHQRFSTIITGGSGDFRTMVDQFVIPSERLDEMDISLIELILADLSKL